MITQACPLHREVGFQWSHGPQLLTVITQVTNRHSSNLFLQIGRFYSYLHPPNKYLAPTQGQSSGSALSAGGSIAWGPRSRQYHSRQRQGQQQEMSVTLLAFLLQCHLYFLQVQLILMACLRGTRTTGHRNLSQRHNHFTTAATQCI